MAIYLTISEGSTAADAEPILATHDKDVIHAVARTIARRLSRRPTTSRGPRRPMVVEGAHPKSEARVRPAEEGSR